MSRFPRTTSNLALAALAALHLAGCGHLALPSAVTKAATAASAKGVPAGFMWGVSTAGYQWEGGDTTSEWAKWDAAGKTSERNVDGADGYKRYEEDADLTKGLGCNAFRTSIEWARIEPTEGQYDQAAIAHYHALLSALHARGLEPVVTLMHFAYPAWLDAEGGWENPQTAQKFARYAAFVAHEFGPQIKYYLTYNEPNVFLLGGYVAGMTPPGRIDPLGGLRALNTMVQGHRQAYDLIHANDPDARVSFNMYTATYNVHVNPFGAPSPSVSPVSEEQATERVTSDTYFLDKVMAPSDAHPHLDFVAFDYYCRLNVTLPNFRFPRPDTWEVYPQGFYDALTSYYERYHLPILVAENGMATWDLAPRADRWTRAAYTVAHVTQMQRAMGEGVPVMGYIQWSITDNYEWGSFSPRFGLYSVDCRHGNFTRVPTDGVDAFRAITAAGGVTGQIARRYPPPTFGPVVAPWEPGGGSAVNAFGF